MRSTAIRSFTRERGLRRQRESRGSRAVYDEAKRFAESLTMAYHRFHKVDTRIVRIFNTYGTHGPRRWACPSELVEAEHLLGQPLTVYGEGNQTRSFCFVDDLVDGIVRLLYSDEHLPVNIGNQDEMSILEFAKRSTASLAIKLALPS